MAHIATFGHNGKGQLGGGFDGLPVLTPMPASVAGERVKQVSVSGESTLALQSDGTVEGWGGDAAGNLGAGTFDAKVINPVKALATGITQLAAGGAHVIGRLQDGKVATWGGNMTGALGNGTTGGGSEIGGTAKSNVPVYLSLTNVARVAAGGGDCATVHADGTVSAWGENRKGQLGLGDTVERTEPVKVPGLEGVIKIAIGGQPTLPTHMLALLSDGTVKAWGAGAGGQLGQGIAQVGTKRLPDSLVPIPVPGLSDVIDIWAGNLASYALKSDGTLEAWGKNANYQLAQPTLDELVVSPRAILSDVFAFAVGFHYCLAVIAGELFAWGKNENATLGDGTVEDKASPTVVAGLSDILALDAGESHAAVLLRGPMQSEQPVALTPGAGSLSLAWQSPATTSQWFVRYRKATLNIRKEPPEAWHSVGIDPSSRSYTITGLTSGQNYEVALSNLAWGRRVLEGTPL